MITLPFTVITLKNCPPSLRGDLTRWMQEISTGVYIGNFNTRVRQYLWDRVCEAKGTGEATISFSYRNEIGYSFLTSNSSTCSVDYEGIPLVMIPSESDREEGGKRGFSRASKFHHTHRNGKLKRQLDDESGYISVAVTLIDGKIAELAAVKACLDKHYLYDAIIKMDEASEGEYNRKTGVTLDAIQNCGKELPTVLNEFQAFAGDMIIVGYDIGSVMRLINKELQKADISAMHNRTMDLMQLVKEQQLFQEDYAFETSLNTYGIKRKTPSRAIYDVEYVSKLRDKLIK